MVASNDNTSSSVSGAFFTGHFGFIDTTLDFCDNIVEELGEILEQEEAWAQKDLQSKARRNRAWRGIRQSLRVDMENGEYRYYSDEHDAAAAELEFGDRPKSLLRPVAYTHGNKLSKRISKSLEGRSPIA